MAAAAPTLTNPSLTAAVCSLEHKAWAALCSSGHDLLFLLSSNPVMIFPSDPILTPVSSTTVHKMLRSLELQPWSDHKLSHDEVIALSEDSAMIDYCTEAQRTHQIFKAICSSAWVLGGQE